MNKNYNSICDGKITLKLVYVNIPHEICLFAVVEYVVNYEMFCAAHRLQTS